ncbi:WXG100 family type VII secretion target [Streptomyces sp. NPDC046716]|uniref:WXG100 family type VII secretion target n=1 Tax=unclassified Streptomyces TaxID=2593676 RepID=UPI0033C57D97
MANTDIYADYDQVATTASTMSHKLADISHELANLETTVSGLLQDGLVLEKASKALQDSYDDFSRQLKESSQGIQSFADTFSKIAEGLAQADSDITTSVQNAGK